MQTTDTLINLEKKIFTPEEELKIAILLASATYEEFLQQVNKTFSIRMQFLYGMTALHHSILNRKTTQIAEYLLNHGFGPNQCYVVGKYHYTPLAKAAISDGTVEMLKFLIDRGADYQNTHWVIEDNEIETYSLTRLLRISGRFKDAKTIGHYIKIHEQRLAQQAEQQQREENEELQPTFYRTDKTVQQSKSLFGHINNYFKQLATCFPFYQARKKQQFDNDNNNLENQNLLSKKTR